MASEIHKSKVKSVSVTDSERNRNSHFFGIRLWFKLEAIIPFILIEMSGAITEFPAAIASSLILSFLGTLTEDRLLRKQPDPQRKAIALILATSLIPLLTYTALLWYLKDNHHLGGLSAFYGISQIIGFLCILVIVARFSMYFFETILFGDHSKRS